MGIINTLKSTWKAASTAEKIELILDAICGFGSSTLMNTIAFKHTQGMNKVQKVCVGIVANGLGIAAANAAVNAFEPYTKALGNVIDIAKAKAQEEKKDE